MLSENIEKKKHIDPCGSNRCLLHSIEIDRDKKTKMNGNLITSTEQNIYNPLKMCRITLSNQINTTIQNYEKKTTNTSRFDYKWMQRV